MPRHATAAGPADQPLAALNITPLIDVLLVLIVMLILTIPIMAHEVPMELPAQGKVPVAERVIHRLAIASDGGTAIDGVRVPAAALPAKLAAIRGETNSVLVLRADDEAHYERFVQTLAVVKRAGITRLGFEGGARSF